MGNKVNTARLSQLLFGMVLALMVGGFPLAATQSTAAQIRAGQAALAAEDPRSALEYYRAALSQLAEGNREDQFVATVGVARAAAWLEDYSVAEASYRAALLLAGNEDERTLASAGLAQM